MKDLFGQNTIPPVDSQKGKRKAEIVYKQMTTLYGFSTGNKCRTCKHFYFREFAKKYPKCNLSGCDGASRSSDWNSLWPACGKFEKEENK